MIKLLKKLIIFLTNAEKRTIFLAQHGFYRNLSDEAFLKKQFKNVFGYALNLEHPKTYSEKLQWLKLYDRDKSYTRLVDKYEVKEYISGLIGEEFVIKTLGVWESFDDIDFNKLPNQFVLKCTHDSGGLVICTDKNKLNMQKARKKINKCLKVNYYWQNREWPYKDVKPKIIAEEYMVDELCNELRDYKFFVFNGKVKAMFIATDRSAKTETCFDFYDEKFNHLPFTNGHPNSKLKISKPENFNKMVSLAEKIGSAIPHCRVDFYEVNGRVYFGEITFFHWSGFKKFEPNIWDQKFGDWLVLPKKQKKG